MNRCCHGCICLFFALTFTGFLASKADADLLTSGNIVAMVDPQSGRPVIREYTTGGALVQQVSNVPAPGAPPGVLSGGSNAKDLVVGNNNELYLINGLHDLYLARHDFDDGFWYQQTYPGWQGGSSAGRGGIAINGRYVFVTDFDWDATPRGIIRFDRLGGQAVRFGGEDDIRDIHLGIDNSIYALEGGVSSPTTLYKYDLATLGLVDSISIPFATNNAIAIAGDGTIVVADSQGRIRRLNGQGQQIDILDVGNGANFNDIHIDADGNIVLGTFSEGDIYVTDMNLDTFSTFHVTGTGINNGGDVFVAWTDATFAVPEPGTFAVLSFVMGISFLTRRRPTRFAAK